MLERVPGFLAVYAFVDNLLLLVYRIAVFCNALRVLVSCYLVASERIRLADINLGSLRLMISLMSGWRNARSTL